MAFCPPVKIPREAAEPRVQCPYNRHHSFPDGRISEHLNKCRRHYINQCKRDGTRVKVFTCRYNASHLLFGPEVLSHERQCEDRHRIDFYPGLEGALNLEGVEESGWWGGLTPDCVQGTGAFGEVTPFEKVRAPGQAVRKEEERRRTEERRRKREELQKLWQEETQGKRRTAEEKQLTQEELEEIEDWNKPPTGPPFDGKKFREEKRDEIMLRSNPLLSREERKALALKVEGKKKKAEEGYWEHLSRHQKAEDQLINRGEVAKPPSRGNVEWTADVSYKEGVDGERDLSWVTRQVDELGPLQEEAE